MAKRLLIEVDLGILRDFPQEQIDIRNIGFLDCLQLIVTPANLPTAKDFLQSHYDDFSMCCDVTNLGRRVADIISLLDKGALRVFITEDQWSYITGDRLLDDMSRLVVFLNYVCSSNEPLTLAKGVSEHVKSLGISAGVSLVIRDMTLLEPFEKYAKEAGIASSCYVKTANDTLEQYEQTLARGHVPILSAQSLTIDPTTYPDCIPVWELISTAIRSDRPDGLFPTVVTDERAVCLGLVYSNRESIEEAVKSGRGVYWSRSRNKLWIKGEESGDTQQLISIRWDCDADALQFLVRQNGDGMEAQSEAQPFFHLIQLTYLRFLPFEDVYLFWTLYWHGAS